MEIYLITAIIFAKYVEIFVAKVVKLTINLAVIVVETFLNNKKLQYNLWLLKHYKKTTLNFKWFHFFFIANFDFFNKNLKI